MSSLVKQKPRRQSQNQKARLLKTLWKKLNASVRNIKINDSAEMVIRTVAGISDILLKTVETLDSVKPQERVKHWKVSVSSRDGKDKIKTLDLKAV